MAIERNIAPSDDFFTGEDKSLPVTVFQADGVTPQDIAGWNLSYMVKAKRSDPDASAKVTKTTAAGIAISGVYNVNPAVNTQRAVITLTDEDINTILSADTLYYHELKRTDIGAETVLTWGTFRLRQSVHR